MMEAWVIKNISRKMELYRDVNSDDFEQLKMDMMPGFRFTWWYTATGKEVKPDIKYKHHTFTKQFVRL